MKYPIHTLSIMNALLSKIFTQIDKNDTPNTEKKKEAKHQVMSQILNAIQTELSGKNILFSFQALAVNLFQYGHTDISNDSEKLIDACMKDLALQVSYPTAKEEKSLDFGWASWFTAPSNLGSSPSFIR